MNPPYHIKVKVNRRLVLRDRRTRHFLFCAEYSSTCYIVEFGHILGEKVFNREVLAPLIG